MQQVPIGGREKNLRLLQGRANYMHRDKRKKGRRNGNSKQQEFQAAEKNEHVEIRAPREMVQWSKPPLGDVKHQDKTHQT